MIKEIMQKLPNFFVKVIAVIFFILMGLNTLLVLTKTAIFPKDYQETLFYENDNAILNIIFLIIHLNPIFTIFSKFLSIPYSFPIIKGRQIKNFSLKKIRSLVIFHSPEFFFKPFFLSCFK